MNNLTEVAFSIEIDNNEENWMYFYRVVGHSLQEVKSILAEKLTEHTGLTGIPKGFKKTEGYTASTEKIEVIFRDTQEVFKQPLTATFKGLFPDNGTFTINYYENLTDWNKAYEQFQRDSDPAVGLAGDYPGHEYADQDDHHAEREREAYKEVGGDYYR
ncbi:hypothetical protein EalM132_00183 [Exiguobacterium phage vB_EalM-132]|nr:hypothetical protein EalM132_00013 [Exiguobacterium phage vB_EalM-132]AYP68695.1 hypothetical protein EalM132_00183 [Exiguobacterium phage vB_EalM-132]